MKHMRFIISFVVLFLSQSIQAKEFDDLDRCYTIQILEKFRIVETYEKPEDVRRVHFAVDKQDVSLLYFYIEDLNTSKGLEAPDSLFINTNGAELVEKGEGNNYDSFSLYRANDGYFKLYRIVNSDGVVIFFATSPINDFSEIDNIVETYDNYISLASVWYVVQYILLIIAGLMTSIGLCSFKDKLLLIIMLLMSLVIVILIILFGSLPSIQASLFPYGSTAVVSFLAMKYGLDIDID